MLRYVSLRYGREPLQIAVPDSFAGERSSEESEIFLSTHPIALTLDEIELCDSVIKALPYNQSLSKGAVMIDEHDPFLSASHAQLNAIEAAESLPSTEFVVNGGQRSVYERVLILREHGCMSIELPVLETKPAPAPAPASVVITAEVVAPEAIPEAAPEVAPEAPAESSSPSGSGGDLPPPTAPASRIRIKK